MNKIIKPTHKRISPEEGLDLFCNAETAELMSMADKARREINKTKTYFTHSLNINPTNICENRCPLCAFWREKNAGDAYFYSIDKISERIKAVQNWDLTDLHIVGGLTQEIDLDYFEKMFRTAKELLPETLIQGLTAVEILFLAEKEGLPLKNVLQRLKDAGLGAIPGGGAEIFAPRVRNIICPEKISADQWLNIHGNAHEIGLHTNATMLFGHIETPEEIIDHLFRLREQQDKTGGFLAFIPLPFHPKGTELQISRGPSGHKITRTVAFARLFLDNFPHIRVLANYLDRKLLQVLIHAGADDVGGTSLDERIAKAAGGRNESCFSSHEEMKLFLNNLSMTPALVNSVYESIEPPEKPVQSEKQQKADTTYRQILNRVKSGERISQSDAIELHDHAPFHELGQAAWKKRISINPEKQATFIIDRNISFTNVCTAGCRFCAFHVKPGSSDSFVIPIEEIVSRVQEAVESGATQIMLQGGLNPELGIDFYEKLFSEIKASSNVWLHSLSPAEILSLSRSSNLTIRECIERLCSAGLDSLPGGGAEILVEEVRQRVSPGKITAEQWFTVMETAHEMGISTTATMVYGLGETTAQRIDHLMRLRKLQDRTKGFRAFIPWSFQSRHTELSLPQQTGIDYLRIIALARIVLDNFPHLQAGWVTEGPDLAQLALSFGADDFGGVLMEESVVSATGLTYSVTAEQVIHLIYEAGFKPAQRNTCYDIVRTFDSQNPFKKINGKERLNE